MSLFVLPRYKYILLEQNKETHRVKSPSASLMMHCYVDGTEFSKELKNEFAGMD